MNIVEAIKNLGFSDPTYIGDAVYAAYSHGDVLLITERENNGFNWMVLEPQAWEALKGYREKRLTEDNG